MASEKPVTGPDPQPAGLISVGAGGAGGGGSSSSVAVMGELRASGSGSVVLPAGMINPSVPIRNIRMKFAVLIGLIQVGEVSNRDIVETVLNLVSGRAPRPGDAPAGSGPLGTGPRCPPPAGAAPYSSPALCNPTGTFIFPAPVSLLHVRPFSNHLSFPNSSCSSLSTLIARPARLLIVRVTEAPPALPKLHAGPYLVHTGHSSPSQCLPPAVSCREGVCAIHNVKNKEIK